MRILAIVMGEYGDRHVANVKEHGPADWEIEVWRAPRMLPPMIDDPEDHLPPSLPDADLILSFAEIPGVAQLIPDIAKMTGATAVVAAIDDEVWLPPGLATQLRGWLEDMDVVCATPKPLCSLTESDYGVTLGERIGYEDERIAAFAEHFGQPKLDITIDPDTRTIVAAGVVRDAVCGCARHVAEGLIGVSADEAEEKAGLLHHHFPCLASMTKLKDFGGDTLMHASGHVVRNDVGDQVKPFKDVRYLKPGETAD